MTLRPLGDRLILEVLEEEEASSGGIVLPDTVKGKPQRGLVVAVGPGARNEHGTRLAMEVSEGDEVVFARYGGTEFTHGTDDVLILRESDLLAVVTPRTSETTRKLAVATA